MVDFYFRDDGVARPGVVVAHGFSRDRRYMAGWGAVLAERGMVAAVPTQPFLAQHSKNANALARLAESGLRGQWPMPLNGKIGLVGFSMGGLTTLTAAARMKAPAQAWVGLDPVDFEGMGGRLAEKVTTPGLVLLAEPAPFNLQGNARTMIKGYAGPLAVLKVKGACHLDPESPVDLLGQLACGWVDAGRQALFRETAVSFLEEVMLGRKRAQKQADGLVTVRVQE